MKKILIGFLAFASISTSFAQWSSPNQMCMGMNTDDEKVETQLFIGKKIDKTVSAADLLIIHNGKKRVEKGTITNKSDLLGTKMFKNTSDSLRYLTSGLLYDTDSVTFQLQMDCSQLKK